MELLYQRAGPRLSAIFCKDTSVQSFQAAMSRNGTQCPRNVVQTDVVTETIPCTFFVNS